MDRKIVTRRVFLKGAVLASVAALAGCAPQVVEVTKIVTEKQVVKETVIVAGTPQVQEKVVEKVVEKLVTAAPAPKGPVTILFYERNIPQDIAFRKELATRFEKENPNIKIKLEVTPDDYGVTLQARIAARTTGDMWRYGTHYGLANYALRGLLWPVDDSVAKDNYDVGVFFQGAIDACRVGGKLYCLPVNGHPGWSGLYYMPELFAAAGIPEPTADFTYDDMMQAAVKLTTGPEAKRDQYGLWLAPYYEAWLTPISAFGGWPMSDDGTKAQMESEKTVAAMQYIVDAMQKQKVALPNPSFDSRVQLWSSGKVAMILSGIWEGSYLGDQTPKGKTLKLAPGPKGPSGQRGGFMGANVFPIWRTSENPYECFQWMKFLCSKEVGIENVARIGEPGLRQDVWEDAKLKNDPLVAPHYELLKVAKPMPVPSNGRLAEIAGPMQQIGEGMFLGKTSVKEGCAQMQKKMQEVLDQPVPGL